jgi:hypothetical protein
MRHELDWGTTKCSCKGWGCKICWASNKQISLHNDLMKFWISKETLKENLSKINWYLNKIDSYTLYEYISGEIDEEKFNEALSNFKSWYKPYISKKKVDEVKDFKPTPNPEKKCVFDSNSPRARCLKCNSIAKYMHWKDCPMYKWNEE